MELRLESLGLNSNPGPGVERHNCGLASLIRGGRSAARDRGISVGIFCDPHSRIPLRSTRRASVDSAALRNLHNVLGPLSDPE
ncbi:unnamed protein product [Bursaphelenchus xylophilus]|uniref:(pine wood nematode) hypothetical protein n=1 Tax=Bursaphelenchus xylophilus TaxID=6326 RepID=A0A1I7SQ13_BURXY|nr:unnamed protein product [Bursaphelenchus xylophilus]CAG9109475.1 unnamed protein product [Bursaphelenchus xylophilus]